MTKKIISIDGGGMYGVIPVEVCIAIEKKLQQSLKETFDLFVGTSTGSLICSAALRGLKEKKSFGLSAEEIMNIYIDSAETIFGKDAENRLQFKYPILNEGKYPKYSSQGLEDVANSVFGAITQSSKIYQAEKKLIITSYNTTKKEPCLFTSWGKDKEIELKQAVIASCSAPQTHHKYKIETNNSDYTDGGVFAGNPALIAYSEAKAEWGDEDMVLISLGTGIPKYKTESTSGDDIKWWIKNIFKIILDGQEESTHNALTQIASNPKNKLQYFRFNCDVEDKKADEIDRNVLEKAREIMRTELKNESATFEKMISALK